MRLVFVSLAVAVIAACGSTEKPTVYTWNVQYVDYRPDQVDDRGPLNAQRAIQEFRRFPFKEQLLKARSVAAPTFPTISFKSVGDSAILAIWSVQPGTYEVYFEQPGRKVTIESRDVRAIERQVERFFGGDRDRLFADLSSQPGAVAIRGFMYQVLDVLS